MSKVSITQLITLEKSLLTSWSISCSLTGFLTYFIVLTPFKKSLVQAWITNKSDFFVKTRIMQSNISSFVDPGWAAVLTSLFLDNKFLHLRYFIIESRISIIFFFGEFLSLESTFGFLFILIFNIFWEVSFYYNFETYQYYHCFSYHYLLINYY